MTSENTPGDEQQTATKPRRRRRRSRSKTAPASRSSEVEAAAEPVAGDAYVERVQTWRDEGFLNHVELEIPEALISNDALRVVERLSELGHLAYVVGGCVRDLALGTEPKDFDVVTTARPEQVRRAFRYSRIIGRRFRLVHVRFGRNRLIEVATFRAQVPEAKEGDDLLVRDDNVYGAPIEDAKRRDFTVNGLFYDPLNGGVVDYVGGMQDLRRKVLRSIGPADVRIQEDPVRMIRAIRFAAKLGFELDGELEVAIRRHGATILRCAPARLWEELLKVLRSGHAASAVPLALQLGFLEHLLPEVAAAMKASPDAFRSLLAAVDGLVQERGTAPDDLVLLAALLLPLVPTAAPRPMISKILGQWNDRFRVPRRLRERLEEALLGVRAMVPEGPWVEDLALARRALFGDALQLLDLVSRASGTGRDLVKSWGALERPVDDEDDR
jgi:poly(A) polymerase